MKKLLVLILMSSLAFCACKKDEPKPETKDTPAAETAAPAEQKADVYAEAMKLLEGISLNNADDTKKIFKEDGKVSPLEYEALLLARSTCKFDEKDFSFEDCDAVSEDYKIRDVMQDREISFDDKLAVIRKVVKHDNHIVRAAAYEAFSMLLTGQDDDVVEKYIGEYFGLVKEEKDAYALNRVLNTFTNYEASLKDFRNFNLEMFKHENADVRAKAVENTSWVCFNRGKALADEAEMDAYHAALVKIIDEDQEYQVVDNALRTLCDFNKESDLDIYKKKLSGDAKEFDSRAMEGLQHYVKEVPELATKAAKIQLEYIQNITEEKPAFMTLRPTPNREQLTKLSAEDPSIKADDFIAALKKNVKENKNFLVCGEAIEQLGEIGTIKDLESVKGDIESSSQKESLQRSYDRALKKLNK